MVLEGFSLNRISLGCSTFQSPLTWLTMTFESEQILVFLTSEPFPARFLETYDRAARRAWYSASLFVLSPMSLKNTLEFLESGSPVSVDWATNAILAALGWVRCSFPMLCPST